METIVIKSTSRKKTKVLLDFLKRNQIKAEVYQEPSKEEILSGIEKGMREVQQHLKGKVLLKEAKHLFDEV